MKTGKFLLMAMAGMGLLACSNEKMDSQVDQSPKSVTITLPNIAPATRATGDAIANNTQVELKDFKVFFLDGSNSPVTVPNEQKVYFDSDIATVTGNKITYHFLPASTAKVVVVGNIGNVEYSALETRTDDLTLLNDTEAGHPAYPLYGESSLTRDNDATDAEGHNNVYTASVTLAPRMSRFEIYGFEYTEGTYESVALKKIALNHYYVKNNFLSMSPVEEGKVWETITSSNAWDWASKAAAPWADELTVTLAPGEGKFVDGTTMDKEATGDDAKNIITYGLAHVTEAANNPELLLTLEATKGGVTTPLYLNGKFTSSVPFNAGKIYRVRFSFKDTDFDQPQRCVELNVTVANWTVVPVTPEF